MSTRMSDRDWFDYKSAIETANYNEDKDALRKIKMRLIADYGPDDDSVYELLKKFRYTV